jgi:parallel beta-helix repeat protein
MKCMYLNLRVARALFLALVCVVLQKGTVAAAVYVDGGIGSSSCNTYNPSTRSCSGGTQTAYRTVSAAAAATVPGSVVLIRGGTYNEQLEPPVSGTAAAPITYQAYAGEVVNLFASPGINLASRSHLIIDGLRVEDTTWLEANNSHSNILRNCTFRRNPNGGTTGNVRFIRSHGNRILNNIFDDGNDNLCIIDANYNVIEGNTFTEGGHSLLTIRCADYNIIRSNYFANTQQKCVEIYDCGADTSAVPNSLDSTKHNVFEHNVFANTQTYYSTSGGNGIQYSAQNGIVRNNVFFNCNIGVSVQHYSDEALYARHNRLYNNVFYNNDGAGIAIRANTVSNIFINNVLFGNKGCVADCDALSAGQIVYRTPLPAGLRFENNAILYQQSGDRVIEVEFGSGATVSQFSSANPGVMVGALEVNPQFVNAAANDFRLQSGSLLIDAGAFLTTAANSGSGTSLVVADPLVFTDGFGIPGEAGDLIQLRGQAQTARITAVNYNTRTLTLSTPLTWTAGQGIALAYAGTGPDIGAFESNSDQPPPPPDTTAPSVVVTSPSNGTSVSGNINVSASASDNTGVSGVQFTLNGASLNSERTFPPYTTAWNTLSTANGSYQLAAVARDAAGNRATSAVVTVTVNNVPDTTPPVISAVSAVPSVSGATITWATDEASDSKVDYGLSASFGSQTPLVTTPVTSHSVSLAGLQAGTVYHFRVRSRDAAGNEGVSAGSTLTTGTNPPPPVFTDGPLPLGVPDPGFGIAETRPNRPATWTAEIPGYYYVHPGAGSDSRTYGHPSAPRSSVPNPIPAGSYVEVHGVYNATSGGITPLRGNGTAGPWVANQSGPCWVVGQDSSNRPVFTQKAILAGTYTYLDGLEFGGGTSEGRLQVGSASGGFAGNHLMVRNCVMRGDRVSSSSAMNVVGATGAAVSNLVVYNNHMYDYGDIASTFDQDACGMLVSEYSFHIWVLGNTIERCSGSGGRFGGGAGSDESLCRFVFVGNNVVRNVRQSGLWVKCATDVVFSQNHCYDIIDTSWSPSKALGAQYRPNRIWYIFNKVHGATYGVRVPSTDPDIDWPVYIIGNLIYDIHTIESSYGGGSWDEAAIHLHGVRVGHVVNNTIYDCDAGIDISASRESFVIANNIVANIAQPDGNHLWVESAMGGSTVQNCLFYQSGGSVRLKWGSSEYSSVSSFQSSSGTGANCVIGDPLFANPVTGQFGIAANSPAANRAVATDVYDEYQRLYGVSIKTDITGKPRPAAWDMGAFEAPSSEIAPPRNVRIVSQAQ